MTEHTPGPWRIGFADGSGAEDFIITTGPLDQTTVVVSGGDSFGFRYGIRDEATAYLIAAAPSLLEAAEAADRLCTDLLKEKPDAVDLWVSTDLLQGQLRAAIALARGEK